ncbi:MAG: hypothetical protein QXO55_02005 [Candidatus Korarchaeum sp.]
MGPLTLSKSELKRAISITLILIAALLILTETSRGILALDSHRIYGLTLSSLLLYLALRLRGSVNRNFLLLFVLSLIFPPTLLLTLLLPRERHEKTRKAVREGEEKFFDLLDASYRSNLIICRSIRLMGSLATSLASRISKHRRVILVDWNGNAHSRLGEVECRIANPSDLWFGYQGNLGSSYYITLSELLSYLTGADPSSILGLLTGDTPPVPRDPRIGDHEPIISSARSGGLRIEDALPKLVGVLIIDASKLNAKGKNLISLMTLFQCSVYTERDFLVIAPLLSPLTDRKLNPRMRDELRWIISSLSKAGCFILSTEESLGFSDEFDNVLECDSCGGPVYKLDGFRLCPRIRDG